MHRAHGDPIRWAGVVAATAAAALLADAAGLPTAALFASLTVGIAYALTLGGARPLTPPRPALTFGQAVIGVSLGAQLTGSTLAAVAGDWVAILLVTIGTLLFSLGAGLALSAMTGVDRPTALLGLIAGGASGIVAMSDELGADARLVAFMQYLRVLVVVLTAPLIATLVLGAGGDAVTIDVGDTDLATGLAFTAGCGIVGVLIAGLLRMTAGSLLVPLALAAALSVSGLVADAHVPRPVEDVAFAAIGLQVGLRFTVATLRDARRLLGAAVLGIAGMIAACAAMAFAVLPLTEVSFSDAYLATTPGGLYAVLAVVAGDGGNVAFVLSVQAIRLFAMVLAAPPLVRLIISKDAARAGPGERSEAGGSVPRA